MMPIGSGQPCLNAACLFYEKQNPCKGVSQRNWGHYSYLAPITKPSGHAVKGADTHDGARPKLKNLEGGSALQDRDDCREGNDPKTDATEQCKHFVYHIYALASNYNPARYL